MKQRIISIPLNVLLFLNTYSETVRSTDSTMLSAFDSASFIVDYFDDFVETYNNVLEEEYDEYCEIDDFTQPSDIYSLDEGLAYGEEEYDYDAEMSERYSPDYLHANYVENIYEIKIVDNYGTEEQTEEDGFFLDFDDDNGYAVVGEECQIYSLKAEGICPFEEEYTEYEKCYLKQNDLFCFRYDDTLIYAGSTEKEDIYCSDTIYGGQLKKGCGRIYDLDSYISQRYGLCYKLESEHEMKMTSFTQYKYSVYLEYDKDKGDWYSESNCWFISGYHILNYLSDNGYTEAPLDVTSENYDPESSEPQIYAKHFDSYGNSTKTYEDENGNIFPSYRLNYGQNGIVSFPKIYIDVREYIESQFGKCDYGSIYDTCMMLNDISSAYGVNFDFQVHNDWKSYLLQGIEQIENDLPLLYRTSNCTYGRHMAAVSAYKKYQRTRRLKFIRVGYDFDVQEYLIFYGLKDGWGRETIDGVTYDTYYFDVSSHCDSGATLTSFPFMQEESQ